MTVLQSYFNQGSVGEVYSHGGQLMLGQVEKIHYVKDATNRSKQFIEYDVSVRDAHGGQSLLRNLRKMEGLGGANDYSETVLEANDYASDGKLNQGNIFKNKNGTLVIVACINKSFDKPFILGAFAHPKTIGGALATGVHKASEFRGVKQEIDKDGNFTLTVQGAKTAKGEAADTTVTPVTFRIGKDGTITTATGHKIAIISEAGKQQIKIQTSANQLFVIDDTTGNETITMLQKQGGMVNITKDGSISITSADGNLLFLNAVDGEASLIQKDGTILSLTNAGITIGDKTGQQILAITDGKIQMSSSGEISNQASAFGVDAGTVELKDQATGVIRLSNGLVAIGKPGAELLDLVDQTLDEFINNAPALVTTVMGPGALSPAIVTALGLIKIALTTIKGSI